MTQDLEKAIEKASHLKIVRIYESKTKLIFYQFFMGMAYGFGAFFGATILIALIIFLLSQFQWVPFVGDFVVQLMQYLEAARRSRFN